LLGAAGTSGARISFFPSLPSGFSERKELGVRGGSRELCIDGVAKERGSLAKGEIPLLIGNGETSAATIRVRLAFEFTEPLPRAAPGFPNSISYEKELIELGDLGIFRL
jgi:hypothetical protein